MSSSDNSCSSPVVRDLQEKKRCLRRIASEVGSMASELRDVRSRMAAQEACLARETSSREAAEAKARSMEMEMKQLQDTLEKKRSQVQTSASVAEQVNIPDSGCPRQSTDDVVPEKWDSVTKLKFLKMFQLIDQYLGELVEVRWKLSKAQVSADEGEASSHLAYSQCSELLKELDQKNTSLQEYESQVMRLGRQVTELRQDLQSRETSQRLLREDVLKLEEEIKSAVTKAGVNKDCELQRILEEVSAKNIENLTKHLSTKDEEIAGLREEVKILSTQLQLKTQELEAQLEKQQRADQELKKRVLKLEFLLQEARSQTRKLQRSAEKRDKELKELRAKVLLRSNDGASTDKPKFWESSRFKYVISISMAILVAFARR